MEPHAGVSRKLEALTRGGHGDRFFAAAAGAGHTFFSPSTAFAATTS